MKIRSQLQKVIFKLSPKKTTLSLCMRIGVPISSGTRNGECMCGCCWWRNTVMAIVQMQRRTLARGELFGRKGLQSIERTAVKSPLLSGTASRRAGNFRADAYVPPAERCLVEVAAKPDHSSSIMHMQNGAGAFLQSSWRVRSHPRRHRQPASQPSYRINIE